MHLTDFPTWYPYFNVTGIKPSINIGYNISLGYYDISSIISTGLLFPLYKISLNFNT